MGVRVDGDASACRLGEGTGGAVHRDGDRLRQVEALAAVSAARVFDEDEDAPLSPVPAAQRRGSGIRLWPPSPSHTCSRSGSARGVSRSRR